jgi:hypothetical protein
MRRVLALFLISAAAVVAAPTIASGGVEEDDLFVELMSPIEPLTFRATFEDEDSCVEDADFEYVVEANGNEVTPISVTQSESDPDAFLFVLPSNTEPGELEIDLECEASEGSSREQGGVLWASMPVTKVVSGPAPATATFTVHLDCQGFSDEIDDEFGPAELPVSFTVDLQYGVAGGVKYAYTDHGVLCTVTEPVNGGATSVTISPQVLDSTPEPGLFPGTVTNTFAAAVQPNFTG